MQNFANTKIQDNQAQTAFGQIKCARGLPVRRRLQVTENFNVIYEKMSGRTVFIPVIFIASGRRMQTWGSLRSMSEDLVLYCIDYGLPYEPGLPLWQEGGSTA